MVGKKYSLLETMIHCYDYSQTAFALDEKTLSEDEMNNVDTARKSNATSATTGKRKAS